MPQPFNTAPSFDRNDAETRPDRAKILEYVQGGALLSAFPEYAGDPEIVRVACTKNASNLGDASYELRSDRTFVESLPPESWRFASGEVIAALARAGHRFHTHR